MVPSKIHNTMNNLTTPQLMVRFNMAKERYYRGNGYTATYLAKIEMNEIQALLKKRGHHIKLKPNEQIKR